MAKKMTEKEIYAVIKKAMADNVEIVEFCDKKVAALVRKAEKAKEKAVEKKAQGDELRDVVKSVLTNELQTIADIVAQIEGEDVTASKITYRLTSLVKIGEAVKEEKTFETSEGKKVKRMAYKLA